MAKKKPPVDLTCCATCAHFKHAGHKSTLNEHKGQYIGLCDVKVPWWAMPLGRRELGVVYGDEGGPQHAPCHTWTPSFAVPPSRPSGVYVSLIGGGGGSGSGGGTITTPILRGKKTKKRKATRR